MKELIKARKIHTCDACGGNIQVGEKYIRESIRTPLLSDDDNETQIGVEYFQYVFHNKDCTPKLSHHFGNYKEIMKNCNYGNHEAAYDGDPDSDGIEYCKYCGKNLTDNNPLN